MTPGASAGGVFACSTFHHRLLPDERRIHLELELDVRLVVKHHARAAR